MTPPLPVDRYRIFAKTCPFHDDGFWLALREQSPKEWTDAVDFDRAIRNGSARANAGGIRCGGQRTPAPVVRVGLPSDDVVALADAMTDALNAVRAPTIVPLVANHEA